MKKTLTLFASVIAVLFLLTSCKSNVVDLPKGMTDTTGFAQFQAWKAMHTEIESSQASVAIKKNPARHVQGTKSVSMNSSTTNEARVAKKKGWSKSAKYAVIGGTGGAVLGAIINKKDPVRGAVVGAVILGGGGYVLGRSQDKKEGRY